jgi:predicted nuclease of predicted toxin-antitoxin system
MIRYLADLNLNHAIVSGLRRREPALDILAGTEAGLEAKPDSEVLLFAAKDGRILVTHDIRTMPTHFSEMLASGVEIPGVLMLSQSLPVAEAIEELLLIWAVTEANEWINRIVRVPQL